MDYIFQVVVLILSAAIHEYMHAWAAWRLGDPTAKNAGRLTLNPLAHLEWFGSFFLPLIMIMMPGNNFIFGWAKPVPYNPNLLNDQKYGEAKVALAGPLANFVLALLFGLSLRFLPFFNMNFVQLLGQIIYINLILMIFNLLPIPPLDGSKVLATFLPPHARERLLNSEKGSFIFIIIFVMVGWSLLTPLINGLFNLIVGL